jgi:glycosyltransferase involved in cell wall biosynthesis
VGFAKDLARQVQYCCLIVDSPPRIRLLRHTDQRWPVNGDVSKAAARSYAFMLEFLTSTSNLPQIRSTPAGAGTEEQSAVSPIPALPAGVLFQASVYGHNSDAEESRAEALGLAQGGMPLRLVPLDATEDSQRQLPRVTRAALDKLGGQRIDLTHSVLYQAGTPTTWNLDFYGRCRIGRTAFGTDRIPDGWSRRCNAMDEVWVPSEFNRETFAAAGVYADKLRVMRSGVDSQRFRPGFLPLTIPHARGFNFLSVTNLLPGSGTDTLLSAYLNEFRLDDDVALILKISEQDSNLEPMAQLAFFIERKLGLKLEKTPPIIVLDNELSYSDYPRLYASAQAFVLPVRGEVCDRPILEALSSGLPVIATRWGGQLDFLNDSNSFLIGLDGLVPATFESELIAGHFWAEPSVQHLRELMREAFSRSDAVRQRADRGRQDVTDRLDWSAVIPEWLKAFRELLESEEHRW